MKLEEAVVEEVRGQMTVTMRLLFAGVFCLVVATLLGLLVVRRQAATDEASHAMREDILQRIDNVYNLVDQRCREVTP